MAKGTNKKPADGAVLEFEARLRAASKIRGHMDARHGRGKRGKNVADETDATDGCQPVALSTPLQEGFIPPHGGYEKFFSYPKTQIIYDATIRFGDRFIDKRSRTHDQMVQAARSGNKNIAEGSRISGTDIRKAVVGFEFQFKRQDKIKMEKQIFKIPIIVTAIVVVLSGCATSQEPQQAAPKSAVQSKTGPTVSGYIDVGAGKSFH